MTVRVLGYRGDGTYYLRDPALELEGLRRGPAGRVLAGDGGRSVTDELSRLLSAPVRGGRRAFDVIVAAPKPVSLLLALEAPRTAAAVVSVHERAVAATLDYLCDDALRTPETAGVPVAVGFVHGVNRLLDPHLHTHVLIGARASDGTPIPSRELRRHASAADALYLAALRHGLADATGRASWLSGSGAMRVEGIDCGLAAEACAPRGRDGRVERERVKAPPTAIEARSHWEAVLARAPRLEPPVVPSADRETVDEHRFTVALGDGAVGRPDVLRAWATACTFGERPDRIRAGASILSSGLATGGVRPALWFRESAAVQVLGPRPTDPGRLAGWLTGRDEVTRFLRDGHRLGDLDGRTHRSARTLLAVARLEAALGQDVVSARADRGVRRAHALELSAPPARS